MHPDIEKSVSEFQRYVGAPSPAWPVLLTSEQALVRNQGEHMMTTSALFKELFKKTRNPVFLRVELMLEELGETLVAIADNDKEKTLDGLVDTVYVVAGTATTFGLPFNDGFTEVHASNMTKTSKAATHDGNKGKGEGFKPANLKAVLKKAGIH